jgi:chloramphenicol-sensitive protein RarD
LGYFITPLINVLLGVFILKEKLTKDQWVSVFFAALGIIILLLQGIGRPEISLGLGLSFGLYGLIKKKGNVEALPSLFFETIVLLVPALVTFWYLYQKNEFAFVTGGLQNTLLSVGAGLVTLIPLLAFGKAVRSVPLTTIGIMQYIAPSLQLLSGVFLFHEPFTKIHFFSFCFIWMGLLIYSLGSFYRYKHPKDLI